MKKIVFMHLLFLILTSTLNSSTHASVTIRAIIGEDVYVALNLENINSTFYSAIKNGKLINESTIPNVILGNLAQQDLTRIEVYTQPIVFNDSSSSINVAFSMTGLDIINFTANTKSMTKTYHVRTDWRKFQVNLTSGFSLSFDEFLDEPVAKWQRIDYTLDANTHLAYNRNFTDPDTFEAAFYFILPSAATNVKAVEDVIIFDLPMSFEDSLLNSPFLILGALLIINVAFYLYRKVRK